MLAAAYTVSLTSSKMGIDAHVTSGATEALPFPIWDMLLSLWIPVLLSHTKIDDMNDYDTCVTTPERKRLEHQPRAKTRGQMKRSLLEAFDPARPIRKLSGLISR